MPEISQMKSSKFLKRDDVGRGALVTIERVTQENVAKEGAEQEMKWCVHFAECEKSMVLNSINAQMIAQITGKTNSDDWTGHKIVLFDDPSVSFGGKLVGGIRVRKPKAGAVKPTPPPVQEPDEDDDLPF